MFCIKISQSHDHESIIIPGTFPRMNHYTIVLNTFPKIRKSEISLKPND